MSLIEIITLAISIISLVAVIYQSINLKLTIESQIYQSFITNSINDIISSRFSVLSFTSSL